MDDSTKAYNLESFKDEEIKLLIKEVYQALIERGYNAHNQIIGYLMSGDPGYISSHNNARKKITQIERSHLIGVILKEFIK